MKRTIKALPKSTSGSVPASRYFHFACIGNLITEVSTNHFLRSVVYGIIICNEINESTHVLIFYRQKRTPTEQITVAMFVFLEHCLEPLCALKQDSKGCDMKTGADPELDFVDPGEQFGIPLRKPSNNIFGN